MDTSIFPDKASIPDDRMLKDALGNSYELWKQLHDFVHMKLPRVTDEWNYPGAKYGWSFRIKDKKRAIIYLLPRKGFFKVAFVFGNKATEQIMASSVAGFIKDELRTARVYAEGRGIRIDILNPSNIKDIEILIQVKLDS